MLEYLHANSLQVKELKKKWLSVLLRHASYIVRECRPKGEEPGPWLSPVAAIKGSAFIGLPAKSFHVGPGPNDFGYALDEGGAATEKLHWTVCLSLDRWEALEIVWRPPVWIQQLLGLEPTDEKDTFAVYWGLVQHILGCSSEATLDIMNTELRR